VPRTVAVSIGGATGVLLARPVTDLAGLVDSAGVASSRVRSVTDPTGLADSTSVVGGSGGTITHGSQIDATNTGHRAYMSPTLGRLLTDADLTAGPTSTSSNNQVIEGKTMSSIDVNHTGVTIKGCWIQGELQNDSTGLVVQYCEIGPRGTEGNGTRGIGVSWDSFSLTRCDIHSFSDGVRLNGTSTMTECYVHDLWSNVGDHNDCVQITGAASSGQILRCKLWNDQGQSAVIQTGSEQGVTQDMVYDSNYIKAPNGAYGVAMGNTGDSGVRRLKVWNNIFDLPSAQADLGERPFEYWILNNTLVGGGVAIPDARVGM
jgi:hypothetical protein